MRNRSFATVVLSIWLLAASLVCAQPDLLPPPRRLDDAECARFSAQEFDELLIKLKAEREALTSDWKKITSAPIVRPPATKDINELEKQLKGALERLKQSKSQPAKNPLPDVPMPKIEPKPPDHGKKVDAPPAAAHPTSTTDDGDTPNMDPLVLAQTLFRAEQYQAALVVFRKIDLKGKKAEERAPIQLMMATCLQHIGKTDDAINLLREIANLRGDERTASYAQWQLDMLRWQRDVQDRLQDIRKRREALEKRP